jgi:hypothetical protein
MQRGYKLLIAGSAILAAGIILIGITFIILKQQSFSINSSIETISPGNPYSRLQKFLQERKWQ